MSTRFRLLPWSALFIGVRPAIGLIALGILALVWLQLSFTLWQGDFRQGYYWAGQHVLSAPAELYAAERCTRGFTNLPLVGVVFVPLGALDFTHAWMIYVPTGLAAIVLSAWMMTRDATSPTQVWASLLLIAVFGPLWDGVRWGNLTHFALPIVVAIVWCLYARRDAWAGALVAIAGVIKTPLGLLVLYFLLRKRVKALVATAITLGLTGLASVALLGVQVHRDWWERCIAPTIAKPTAAYNVQSVDGVLSRLYGASGLSFTPNDFSGTSFSLVRTAVLLLLFGTVVWALLRNRSTIVVECSLILTLAVLTFPLAWIHYYLYLLVPLILVTPRVWPLSGMRAFLFAASIVLLIVPSLRPKVAPSPLGSLLWSHYFFGGLLLLVWLLDVHLRAPSAGQAGRDRRGDEDRGPRATDDAHEHGVREPA